MRLQRHPACKTHTHPNVPLNSTANHHAYLPYLQYWDWGRWAEDPESSPIFDGSETSLSGNGEKIDHEGTPMIPAGNGGGCVKSGPFKE